MKVLGRWLSKLSMEIRVPASASIVESWLWWHVLVIQHRGTDRQNPGAHWSANPRSC